MIKGRRALWVVCLLLQALLFAQSLSAWPSGQPTSQLGAQGAQLGSFVLGAIPAPTGPSTGFSGGFTYGLGLGPR